MNSFIHLFIPILLSTPAIQYNVTYMYLQFFNQWDENNDKRTVNDSDSFA